MYHLYFLTKTQYLTYMELAKSKAIEKCIFEFKEQDTYYLLFNSIENVSEDMAVLKKMLPLLEEVFHDFAFSITLKKEHFINLTNIYKVLDNKFSYFEIRIREIETAPIKNDISWVILSKYNIVLDAKMFLYDLQQDIFSFIDKNEVVEYGMLFRNVTKLNYKNGFIEPNFDVYYGPEAMLYCRLLFYFDHLNISAYIKERVQKLDTFNRKYFCFMCIYIYILNLNMDILLTPYNIGNYLQITRRISVFLKEFGDYVK